MTEQPGQRPASEQAAQWNGGSGEAWVDLQDVLDGMLAPLAEPLVDAAVDAAPGRVLDVGCGTGATTVAIARQLGAQAACVGVDISQPMVAAARARAARDDVAVSFVVADAETDTLPAPGFDLIVSRFGVMFFADPIAAFAQLLCAAADDGRLCMGVWRGPEDNPFMTAAERAVAPILEIPAREPGVPGPFGLADRDRAGEILDRAGWASIEITPIDVACTLPERDLTRYFTRIGPLSRVLSTVDPDDRAALVARARSGFEPFVDGADVRYTAACWRISARA